MRESNFAFPTQNKACVCITSQLYDRRALDTTAALPLFNSLTHLTYLTSTSPRIREIMTMDGGLERLVKILHDFCICPPPPENAAILYGLLPPNARPPKLTPTLHPQPHDKQAAYRFSLAFQCVVNIGVRGSEPIRSRVVQAGTLDVVGCVLEAWLANKGFAIGPSSSATGLPRETREQRQARRDAHMQQRQRDQAAQLARQLEQMQQQQMQQQQQQQQRGQSRPSLRLPRVHDSYTTEDEIMDISPTASGSSDILLLPTSSSTPSGAPSTSNSDTDMSTTATPIRSGTPTGSVVIPGRDRSGTIVARPVWDPSPATTGAAGEGVNNRNSAGRHRSYRRDAGFSRSSPSASPPTDNSRPETETEDDGDEQGDDGDIDMNRAERRRLLRSRRHPDSDGPSTSASPSPERSPRPFPRPHRQRLSLSRRAVGIISDEAAAGEVGAMELSTDAHIIINDAGGAGEGGVGMRVGGVGVEDGLVSLEPNDDFAMGAPPGAPGAIEETPTTRGLPLETGRRVRSVPGDAPDITPRAGVVGLPIIDAGPGVPPGRMGPGGHHHLHPNHQQHHGHQRNATIRGHTDAAAAAAASTTTAAGGRTSGHGSSHHDNGIYRDEDVLLGLQLLAYLSKYPHVRQAFYKPRASFHPASVNLPGARYGVTGKMKEKEREKATVDPSGSFNAVKETQGSLRGFPSGRGKDRDNTGPKASPLVSPSPPPSSTTVRQTNVFSLVERFTFKPSSSETDLPNPPPRLPTEIQYWAGVIMRNACRKDDSRGGIRQCANMLCGRWEAYPREFAKCRRCRKAKYCGKECQSTAWSEGHRFWCSAKDGDDDATGDQPQHHQHSTAAQNQTLEEVGEISIAPDDSTDALVPIGMTLGGTVVGRPERRRERFQGTAVNDAGHARTGGASHRGTVATRGEGHSTRVVHQQVRQQQHQHQHQPRPVPVVPSPSRTRGIDLRPQMPTAPASPTNNNAVVGNGNGNGSYLTFEMYPELGGGGRRRAETVTGATSVIGEGSLRTHHHPHLQVQSRNHPPNPMRFVPAQHARPVESGQVSTARRRRGDNGTVGTTGGFRLPVEDHDMVLG